MIEVRPYASLGRHDNAWLSARHHFSFAEYHDPERMRFGSLRVWNDDVIQPGKGFSPHRHYDMEIVTYVRAGAVSHEDHLGNRERIEAGQVQAMTAGTGIVHSEFNRESTPTELFQIWFIPNAEGLKPHWASRALPRPQHGVSGVFGESPGGRSAEQDRARADRAGHEPEPSPAPVVLVSGRPQDKDSGALPIHADAALLEATLAPGQRLVYPVDEHRQVYLVPVRGWVTVNDHGVKAREAAAATDERELVIEAKEASTVLITDLGA